MFFYWILIILPFFATAQNIDLKYLGLDRSEPSSMNELIKSKNADDIHKALKALYQTHAIPTSKKIISTLEEFYEMAQEKASQILYPEWYSEISEDTNYYILQKALKTLDSSCANTDVLSDAVSKLHPGYWPELKDKLKHHKDKKLLDELAQKIYEILEQERFPKKCLDSAHKNHEVCKKINKKVSTKVQRFNHLIEWAYDPDILSATEASASCFNCVEESLPKELSDFKNLLPLLQEQILCSDPAPKGEKTVTNGGPHVSRRFVFPTYTVRREQDGSFTIPLDIRFVAGWDYNGEVPKDKIPAHYKNKVQNCLNKANPKMLGPNGQRLNLVIENPKTNEDSCKAQNTKVIKIVSSNRRKSYSNKYVAGDMPCPLVLHEVLHLLGLCDEYEDLSYNCRPIIPDSIMGSSYGRWAEVFRYGTKKSLLNPDQFNAILYGKCLSKNKFFNECAELTYESGDDCLKQKELCEKQRD